MKANSITVFNYVKANEAKNITAADVAEATGLEKKSVDGIVTMVFCRHKDENKEIVPLMERIAGEIEQADGSHKAVKFIRLTEAGKNFVPVEDAPAE